MVKIYVPSLKKDKIIHFGNTKYQDYLQHHDKQRQKNYLYRSSFLKKGGKFSKDDYTSPNFWSRRVLWKSREKYGKLPLP